MTWVSFDPVITFTQRSRSTVSMLNCWQGGGGATIDLLSGSDPGMGRVAWSFLGPGNGYECSYMTCVYRLDGAGHFVEDGFEFLNYRDTEDVVARLEFDILGDAYTSTATHMTVYAWPTFGGGGIDLVSVVPTWRKNQGFTMLRDLTGMSHADGYPAHYDRDANAIASPVGPASGGGNYVIRKVFDSYWAQIDFHPRFFAASGDTLGAFTTPNGIDYYEFDVTVGSRPRLWLDLATTAAAPRGWGMAMASRT